MFTPISSATIWVMVVSMLCPWLPVPMYTLTLPLGSTRIVAASAPPAPAPGCGSMYSDSPMPTSRPSARACSWSLRNWS